MSLDEQIRETERLIDKLEAVPEPDFGMQLSLGSLRKRLVEQQSEYVTRLEDALCTAICIIQNYGMPTETQRKWADELIAESGLPFDDVLERHNTETPEDSE